MEVAILGRVETRPKRPSELPRPETPVSRPAASTRQFAAAIIDRQTAAVDPRRGKPDKIKFPVAFSCFGNPFTGGMVKRRQIQHLRRSKSIEEFY